MLSYILTNTWILNNARKLTDLIFSNLFFVFYFLGPFWSFRAPGSVKNVLGVLFGARCNIFRHFWWTERQNDEKVSLQFEWKALPDVPPSTCICLNSAMGKDFFMVPAYVVKQFTAVI